MKYLICVLFFAMLFVSCDESSTPVLLTSNASQKAILTPFPVAEVYREPRFSIAPTHDVVYGMGLRRDSWTAETGDRVPLVLDIYSPDTPSERPRPAMVLIHGGGFEGGSADFPNMVDTAEYFAGRGWVVFVVNYRLKADFGSIPTNLPSELVGAHYPASRDVKAAVRWLHANAAQYNISTNHVSALGGSVGGMLAVMLGISDATDYRDEISMAMDPTLPMTYLEYPANIQTVVSFWGGGPLVDVLTQIDGRPRYDANDPPTLLVHGTADERNTIVNSEMVYNGLVEVGVPVEFYRLPGYGHSAWDAVLEDGRTIYTLAFDFIVEQQQLRVGE
jgi:acetyl esterase/lipase